MKFGTVFQAVVMALSSTLPVNGEARAQLIASRDQLTFTIEPTDKLRSGQVYAITPNNSLKLLEGQLVGAGIVVAPSSDSTRLVVAIETYDSGPYLGFAKTARIAVQYRLLKPGAAEGVEWTDRCEARANVDVQDAPDRNRTAVGLCLTALGSRLAEKLLGPSETVVVN